MYQNLAVLWVCFMVQGCASVFYHPDRYLRHTPEKFDLKYSEYFIDSERNELVVWRIPPKDITGRPVGTVVQFHGNAENMSSHFLSLIWMVERNLELVTFDYRGYGASDGEPSQLGLRTDGIAALEEALECHKKSGSGKFIVYGQSLGGAVALDAIINWKKKDEIDLLVLDSTFSKYSEVAATKLKGSWMTWIFHPLAYIGIADDTSPADSLGEVSNIPVLVVHGNQDVVVPIDSGKELYGSLTGTKFWWELDGGKHLQNFHGNYAYKRDEFIDLIKKL